MKEEDGCGPLMVVFVIGLLSGLMIGSCIMDNSWKKETVIHQVAEWRVKDNGNTVWHWKDEKK